jgi:hypothetical protein
LHLLAAKRDAAACIAAVHDGFEGELFAVVVMQGFIGNAAFDRGVAHVKPTGDFHDGGVDGAELLEFGEVDA